MSSACGYRFALCNFYGTEATIHSSELRGPFIMAGTALSLCFSSMFRHAPLTVVVAMMSEMGTEEATTGILLVMPKEQGTGPGFPQRLVIVC